MSSTEFFLVGVVVILSLLMFLPTVAVFDGRYSKRIAAIAAFEATLAATLALGDLPSIDEPLERYASSVGTFIAGFLSMVIYRRSVQQPNGREVHDLFKFLKALLAGPAITALLAAAAYVPAQICLFLSGMFMSATAGVVGVVYWVVAVYAVALILELRIVPFASRLTGRQSLTPA